MFAAPHAVALPVSGEKSAKRASPDSASDSLDDLLKLPPIPRKPFVPSLLQLPRASGIAWCDFVLLQLFDQARACCRGRWSAIKRLSLLAPSDCSQAHIIYHFLPDCMPFKLSSPPLLFTRCLPSCLSCSVFCPVLSVFDHVMAAWYYRFCPLLNSPDLEKGLLTRSSSDGGNGRG